MKILVVDDEPVVRDLTVEILRRGGHEPHGVESARVALDLLARETYDLVVTDVVMPDMTGVELLDQLRARGDEVPVLLMTGGSQEPERTSNALRLGASGLLYKPFSGAELTAAVESAVRS